jgi:exodeoxyribonuclease III
MRIISWNVNGLRAAVKKDFIGFLESDTPDIIGLQETKLQEDQIPKEIHDLDKYHKYWNCAEKKGYSGVALFTKEKPLEITYSLGEEHFDREGRVIIAHFENFSLINCYFPNGQMNADRLKYKLDFYDRMLEVMQEIRNSGKNLIVFGDVNTAHKPIDLANPKANEKYSGFLPIERAWIDKIVADNWTDTYRYFDESAAKYTWWTYRSNARERNIGWRIDYFFADADFMKNIKNAFILHDVCGSDHCPLGIEL